MSRSLKLVFSKEGIKKSWKYSSSNYCTYCGHHHCYDPTSVYGVKSLKKSKGTGIEKRYQKDLMFIDYDREDDG